MKTQMQLDFEAWQGFGVNENMDIQTEVAWDNWRAAWKASARHAAHLCHLLGDTAASTKGIRQHETAFRAAESEILKQFSKSQ